MSRIPAATTTTPLLNTYDSSAHGPSRQPRASTSRLGPPSSRLDTSVPRPSYPRAPSSFRSDHSYQAIPASKRRRHKTPRGHFLPALLTVIVISLAAFVAWDVSSLGNCWLKPLCRVLGDRERREMVWWRNSGTLAPWRSKGQGGGKRGLPRGCTINQVTVLHRHAARYPVSFSEQCLKNALGKLARRKVKVPKRHAELAFLRSADLELRDWHMDQLSDQGRKEAWRSGREVAALYAQFLQSGDDFEAFSRSTDQNRVMESAGYWLMGFRGESFALKAMDALPDVDVLLPERSDFNNTLAFRNCPAYDNHSKPRYSALMDKLLPALDRLNSALEPSPPLELAEIACLAPMCAYDSQRTEDWEAWSRWCSVFTPDEWEILGHIRDVEKYYSVGKGSSLGPTLGAGWTNELLARLTDSSPDAQDLTSINRTLDTDESTFPRGGNRLFVDFSHDNEMIAILASLGLVKQHRALPTDSLPEKRTFLVAEIAPFGARVVFERIGCTLGDWEPEMSETMDDGRRDYVRIFINDAVQLIDTIDCQQSGYVEHGMCEVSLFVTDQSWAREEVDWKVCFSQG